MKAINRNELLADIKEFVTSDSGLIVGKPGVGKTYILNQLTDLLLADDVVVLFIAINDLYDGSDDAISTFLNLPPGNWIELLADINTEDGRKGILIFDAFDAARDEKFRSQILSHIKKVKAKLADKWNIIVSVRTYDASKSEELIRLFPKGDPMQAVTCRKIDIPNFTDSEIEQLKDVLSELYDFYRQSGPSLKEVLHNPFFLYLANEVIKHATPGEILEYRGFKSESQLLHTFWNKKIFNTEQYVQKEMLLRELSHKLVEATKLNMPKSDIMSIQDEGRARAFEILCGENILSQVSTGGRRVTYSHNILFDYAVSRYVIPIETDEFITFILTDRSRPFFLRPSYIYFFTQLWYEERGNFWKFYFILFQRDENVIQLFHRIVLASVLASCFSATEDLDPIFDSKFVSFFPTIVKYILQSLRFVRDKTASKDLMLLERLSTTPKIDFLQDFNFVLNRAIDNFKADDLSMDLIGRISRDLLSHVLSERKKDKSGIFDWLGQFAVEYVCKTYKSDPAASKQLLESVLNILKEEKFPISYFSSLCEYISVLVGVDSKFVSEVYNAIFSHRETSQDTTIIGPPSVVMGFRSTRQQDYELCWYRLTDLFPELLKADPAEAIEVGLHIANRLIISDDHLLKEYEARVCFDLHGEKCEICSDHSFLKLGNNDQDYSTRFISAIYKYLANKIIESNNIDRLLLKAARSSLVGYTWSRLLHFGTNHINRLHGFFYDFCLAEVLLYAPDTRFEISALIESITPFLSAKQIEDIENTIHTIAESGIIGDKDEYLKNLLSRIGTEQLKRTDSKKLLAEKGIVDNTPLAHSHFEYGQYTNEQYFENHGIDLTNFINATINTAVNKLEAFNQLWQNKNPERSDYKAILQFTIKTYQEWKAMENINTIVETSLLRAIAATLRIISHDYTNIKDKEFKQIKEALIKCLKYLTPSESDGSFQGSAAHGYSPTPRTEAAGALVNLWLKQPDKEIEECLRLSLNSDNSVVRFHAMHQFERTAVDSLEFYKENIVNRAINEPDGFNCAVIIGNINIQKFSLPDLDTILYAFFNKDLYKNKNDSFLDNYSLLLIRLAFYHNNETAKKILNSAITKTTFCNTIIYKLCYEASYCLTQLDNEKHRKFIDLAIDQMLRYVSAINKIITVQITIKGIAPTDITEQYTIINQIILRLFFVFERPGNVRRKMDSDGIAYLFPRIKPILLAILNLSIINAEGITMPGITAHHFVQILNMVLDQDPKDVLKMATATLRYSFKSGYSFDYNSIQQIIRLTEKLLADHREVLQEEDSFSDLIELLEIYVKSNWIAALQLLWRLDEIFK